MNLIYISESYFFILIILIIILLKFMNGNKKCMNYDYFGTYSKTQRDPVIPARAKVIYKRTIDPFQTKSTKAVGYIVFEFDSKDRIELQVPIEDFNLIFEGDKGVLTFQGNRFIRFDRNAN